MIPVVPDLEVTLQDESYGTKDHKMNVNKNVMGGFVDDLEAVKQACYLILNIERFDYLIYSWNYGVELKDLIGQPRSYVYSELKRRVEEALLQDDRILNVTSGDIDIGKRHIRAKFEIETVYGSFQEEVEVEA